MRRSLAFAIDGGIWGAIAVVGALSLGSLWAEHGPQLFDTNAASQFVLTLFVVTQAILLVYGLVQLILSGRIGRTVGKAIVGLRVVKAESLGRPGFFRVVGRSALIGVSAVFLPILGPALFLLSPLWDAQRLGKGWHDQIVGCWVLDVRRGLDPFDAKAMRLARKAAAFESIEPSVELPDLASNADEGGNFAFFPSARSRSGVIALHGSTAASEGLFVPAAPSLQSQPPSSELKLTQFERRYLHAASGGRFATSQAG
nr:RDD family protein [Leifsonia psychrotolerans]